MKSNPYLFGKEILAENVKATVSPLAVKNKTMVGGVINLYMF